MIGGGHFGPINNGLCNWYAAWDYYSDQLSSPPHVMVLSEEVTASNAWKRIGFMRYSPEYWLLARLMIDRLQRSEDGTDATACSYKDESEHEPVDAAAHTLANFDQTSMQQVNSLISELQDVRISTD